MTSDPQWRDAIEARLNELEGLRREVIDLRAENERLRTAVEAAASGPVNVGAAPGPAISRRGMFAAIAGAAGGIVLAQAAPAAAANGDALKAGQNTTSSTQTGLFSSDGGNPGLYVANTAPDSTSAAVIGDSFATTGASVGVDGRCSSTSGIGVRGVAGASSGSAYGVKGTSWSATGSGVYGEALSLSGPSIGVRGSARSPAGFGMLGSGGAIGVLGKSSGRAGVVGQSLRTTGECTGIDGTAVSPAGIGVQGRALATGGRPVGVLGSSESPRGFGVVSSGRFKATGRSFLATPNSAPDSADLANGSISFYLDQANGRLKVRVKYSTGTVKTASISLT